MKIDRNKLIRILRRIQDHLSSLSTDPEVEGDLYWVVLPPEWEDFSHGSPEISTGSLVDEWSELSRLLDEDEVVSFLDYDRVAAVLRHVSEVFCPVEPQNSSQTTKIGTSSADSDDD
jgi:hypothetical protein